MPSRLYFYDSLTGEEIRCALSGSEMRREMGAAVSARSGAVFADALFAMEVKSPAGKVTMVTADTFGDRLVTVCEWRGPGRRVKTLLVRESDGFRKYGAGDDYANAYLLPNRTALAWIAARRATRETVAA